VDVLALIGTIAGVISAFGVPIAYLQLRAERTRKDTPVEDENALAAKLPDLSLFAPTARYLGFDVDMVDRHAESAELARQLRSGRSVIAIEGIAGIGKTTLAAHACHRAGSGRKVRWVFCDEKATALTITTLAKALASGVSSPTAIRLRTAIRKNADIIDTVIDFLAEQRLILVLDNLYAVTDADIHELLVRLEHSAIASCVLVTSRVRLRELRAVPLVGELMLDGLSAADTHALLRQRDVRLSPTSATLVWQRAGNGNPLALTRFAGRARHTNPEELALRLPDSVEDFDEWIALAYDDLASESRTVAKIIAFAYEPITREALRLIASSLDPQAAIADLTDRLMVRNNAGRFEMHSAVRDYLTRQTTESEQDDFATRFTEYYRTQARTVFLNGLGDDEPSYGRLYLESFPDYIAATERHIALVDDLIDRLADNGHPLARGAHVLVLGSGDGTHDPGLAKHGLVITNVDIQPDIVDLGQQRADTLPAEISYVVADMTEPLPPVIAKKSMDAVFNIGSSFGYETADETNAMVFRNVAAALRDDAPFLFEYVNGPHWENKRVQSQIDDTTLPDGSIRTEVSITDPHARTSLTLVGLRRPDGTAGWFRHFMHYYRLPEILAMMTDAGLRPIATYSARGGRVTGEPFDERTAEAMVVIAVPDRP
jgi:hypothetical protein